MKVLVIGSGGREHALLWKLAHSPTVKEVYVIPGNDGMTDVAHLIPVKGTEDILDFARLMEVDLTVAGPETVLTEGLADKFAEKGMAFFGPSAAAAQICCPSGVPLGVRRGPESSHRTDTPRSRPPRAPR